MKHFLSLIGLLSICAQAPCAYSPRGGQPVIRREAFEDLRHEVSNHEVELKMLEERLNIQENIVDSLRDQFNEAHTAQSKAAKGNTTAFESRVAALESSTKSLKTDLKKIQGHSNDSVNALNKARKKIDDLESLVKKQSRDIESMQSAMKSLLDAFPSSEETAYRVKAGDSLDKIARSHGVTVRSLKERNQLKNDRIISGQVLKIPQRA